MLDGFAHTTLARIAWRCAWAVATLAAGWAVTPLRPVAASIAPIAPIAAAAAAPVADAVAPCSQAPCPVVRREIEAALERLGDSGCRLVPAFRAGKAIGIKLFAVDRSFLGDLGFEDGDIVQRINGDELLKPGLDAYVGWKTATSFDVELLRAGVPLHLRYDVR